MYDRDRVSAGRTTMFAAVVVALSVKLTDSVSVTVSLLTSAIVSVNDINSESAILFT